MEGAGKAVVKEDPSSRIGKSSGGTPKLDIEF